jgi:uroporphyrinogen decarboxylase
VPAAYGGYWEPITAPLMGQTDLAVLDNYAWPQLDWFDFAALDAQLDAYRDYAIMTGPGPASPGPLATIQWLLGMEGALSEMLLHPEFYQALVDRIVEFDLALLTRMAEVAGDRIDFYRLGDDFGTQQSLLMSPKVFRRFFQPFMKTVGELARRHGGYYYHHTCGAIRPLIPAFIETGMDVVDPVQVGAAGMTPAELKAEFGDRICFSGGVDEQYLLPNGTPQQVRDAVFRLLDDMAPGGGFFIGPTHNLQADIPTENIVAMYDAAREWTYR